MGVVSSKRSITMVGLNFKKNSNTTLENGVTIEKELSVANANSSLAGVLTTRTTGVAGVITTTDSPAGIIATNDPILVSWGGDDLSDSYAYFGIVSGVVGNAITFALLQGTALPIATTPVHISKIHQEPLPGVAVASSRVAITNKTAGKKLFFALCLAADIDSTPDVTNAILGTCSGNEGAAIYETQAELVAAKATFTSADSLYIANMSLGTMNMQAATMKN